MKQLRLKDICARFGKNRVTIWRWITEKRFPEPKRISPKSFYWLESDIDKWEAGL